MEITAKLIKEAKNHPNGWIYVIDKEFEEKEDVSPEFIKGAWKVNNNGILQGEFVPNPNYHKNK